MVLFAKHNHADRKQNALDKLDSGVVLMSKTWDELVTSAGDIGYCL